MTRFMRELSGSLGCYWKEQAEKELDSVREELNSGRITIDENGVARNCIGRVLMADMLEKVVLVTDKVDPTATSLAREAEVAEKLKNYRANKHSHSPEDLAEMRAAFGPGATVVDVLTDERIRL